MRRTPALEEQVLKCIREDQLSCEVEVPRPSPAHASKTLRVSRTRRTVILTLPVQCFGEAGNFLNRNLEWVRERLDSLLQPCLRRRGAVAARRLPRLAFNRQAQYWRRRATIVRGNRGTGAAC